MHGQYQFFFSDLPTAYLQVCLKTRQNPESRPAPVISYLHDKCRIDNGRDIEHGKRAAIMINGIRHTLLKELTDNEFELLSKACKLHTTTLRTGNPTIDTCFDADRLDLERVGIIPYPNKMATSKGQYYAKNLGEFYDLAVLLTME